MLDRRGPFYGCREQFPVKLYALLALADRGGAASAAGWGWLPHGRAFRIVDERAFMRCAVPLFFRQTKFRSFCRQLNLWGYRRVLTGVDAGAWHHKHFLRGRPDEMRKMVRVKIKGTKDKDRDDATSGSGPSDRGDPDFYAMPPLPPASEGGSIVAASAMLGARGGMSGLGAAATDALLLRGRHACQQLGHAGHQGPMGSGRRVTLEAAATPAPSPGAFRFHDRPNLNVPPPSSSSAAAFVRSPRSIASPNNEAFPLLPTPVCRDAGAAGPLGGCPRGHGILLPAVPAPSSASPHRPPPHLRPSPSLPSEALARRPLSRRSKSSPASPPSDEEMAWIKQRLVAGVVPLPFGKPSSSSSPSPFSPMEEDPAAKAALTAGLEPLPFDWDTPSDEFASYIDNVIQMV